MPADYCPCRGATSPENMKTKSIDHVCIHIPKDGVDEFVALYRDALGFDLEGLDAYRANEQDFFRIRLTEYSTLQISPTTPFSPSTDAGFDHIALRIEESQPEVLRRLEESEAEIRTVIRERVGATGTAPAIYFTDAFGYTVELRTDNTHG